MGIEAKTGIVTMAKAGGQIAKDSLLLARKRLDVVIWVFKKGSKVSKKVLDTLEDNGIKYFFR